MMNLPLLLSMIISLVLIYCSFASRITEKLNENVNIIYTSLWYLLPSEQQRYIVNMISFAQSNHTFLGFKMVPCSLQTFAAVSKYSSSVFPIVPTCPQDSALKMFYFFQFQIMKASASYYLMMKQL